MYCPNCGAAVSDGSAFCANCGTKLNKKPQTSPETNYVPKHASPEPGRPAAAPAPVWDSVQKPAPAAKPVRTRQKQDYAALAKNPKVLVPVISAVALILVIALVIGIVSSVGGPLVKIAAAAQKTLKADNFTAEFEVEIDGDSMEGTVFADIDTKNRTVSMLISLEADGKDITLGIYDGQSFGLYENGSYTYGYTQDIEDELDDIFDAWEESGSTDLTELLENIDELMYDYTGEELSDYFNLEELEVCLKAYAKALSKENWLQENMGYAKSKKNGETLYTFEPGMYDFLMASLPYFESSFEDSDMYDDMMESLEDVGDDIDDEFAVELALGVKSGYLSSVTAVMEMDGEELEMSLKLYDVNKTKLDPSELEDLLDDAERYS